MKKGGKSDSKSSPSTAGKDVLLSMVDLVTPNEVEAEIMTGIPVSDKAAADQAAKWFMDRGVKKVLITLGSRGVYIHDGIKSEFFQHTE